MKTYIILVYFVVAALNIAGIYFGVAYLEFSAKIMLMPTLLIFLTVKWSGKKNNIFFLSILALLFSWIGDILLIINNIDESYFIYGLLAFLVAHIIYILVYYHAQTATNEVPNRVFIGSRIAILAFAAGAFLNVLWPKLQDYQFHVTAYTLAILLMTVFAVLRRGRTNSGSFSFIYGGALMFMVSDGMIAVSRFLHPFAFQSEMIMITYILAQLFIIRGIVEHQRFVTQTVA